MVWFLVVLIVVGIVYVFWVIGHYNSEVAESQDNIRDLEQQAALLEKTVMHERESINQRRNQLEDLNQATNDTKQEIFLTDTKLKMAQKEENDLEMSMYKHEFKKSKKAQY